MNIDEAIKVLKNLQAHDRRSIIEVDRKAIDTVVEHYEESSKIDFLKSAKEPNEITHPYDLSRRR
jgi:hypothetical protein